MDWYVKGLLLEGERKSIDPMAGRLVEDAGEQEAMRQRLQQCVSGSAWADEEVMRRLALKLEAELPDIKALVLEARGDGGVTLDNQNASRTCHRRPPRERGSRPAFAGVGSITPSE